MGSLAWASIACPPMAGGMSEKKKCIFYVTKTNGVMKTWFVMQTNI